LVRRRDAPALRNRGGNIRSLSLDHKDVSSALRKHPDENSRLVTDKAQHCHLFMPTPEQHQSGRSFQVRISPCDVHTNIAEGFFSLFKRGLTGT
jgi:hypothetical protein